MDLNKASPPNDLGRDEPGAGLPVALHSEFLCQSGPLLLPQVLDQDACQVQTPTRMSAPEGRLLWLHVAKRKRLGTASGWSSSGDPVPTTTATAAEAEFGTPGSSCRVDASSSMTFRR